MRDANHIRLRISSGISPKEIQDEKGSLYRISNCCVHDVRSTPAKGTCQDAGDFGRGAKPYADLPARLRAVNFGGLYA